MNKNTKKSSTQQGQTNRRKNTIGSLVRGMLKRNVAAEKILAAVQKKFPDSKANLQHIHWYKHDAKQRGELAA